MFEPRLEASHNHKPKSFPPDLLKLTKESLKEKYALFFENKDLKAEGAIYPEEFIVLIGFSDKNSIRQFNFECSMDYAEDSQVLDLIHLAIDAIDSMLSEEIQKTSKVDEDSEILWPQSWTRYTFENKPVFLKTSTINTDIEKMASQFLRENDTTLLEDSSLLESPQDLH